MEIVRKATFVRHSEQLRSAFLPVVDRPAHQPASVEHVHSYRRGYLTGKHDGTLAGLCIGALAGIVAAMVIGSLV